jgi:NADPH2:quinone reductase
MKAVLCKVYGPPESLIVEEVESPKPEPGQVVISVRACGVNFMDTLIIEGKYQSKPPMPFSPGGEVAGIVKEVGEGVAGVKIGDRVIAFTGWGGFAEEVRAEARSLVPMPDWMDFVTASAVVTVYGTSHYALKDRATLQPGETLLVLGAAGGVGLATIDLGKAMGARVIAAASSDEKLAICHQHGADECINYTREDLKERTKQVTGGQGVDVIYDPVGGVYAEPALRSMAWGGRYLVVGFAAGEIPRLPLNLLLVKGCAIIGVFWGSFTAHDPQRSRAHLRELMTWFHEGRLRPHIWATYPLERAADALNDLRTRKVAGKAVLLLEER